MAEPIGLASELLRLVVFAFQSGNTLYRVVESFQNNQRTIRDLREELEALSKVLQSLYETTANTDADLTALKLPLLQCGKACKEFEAVIIKSERQVIDVKVERRRWRW